ncbi:lipopolysaccharide biosynthesis protein [Bradyrhizobium macuxiense]|uniref:Lipopolysaccharide biosynthesis protein n=1 Tax=Bradyrhizobium macuxiense TaxID=1755647 RepID=A0A120FQT3_9BRAD|nr:exopolysaccharide transport family protein [Bradyrhizobium macuxiense]KWV58999.1 lipopolysaccharide biosynthesis protein [Bradyrhizobium macuxiense]
MPVTDRGGARPEFRKAALTIPGAVAFFRNNGLRVALLSLALFAAGVGLLMMLPLHYAATALVVVDPREQRVTNDQDVLPGIGQDAAALQSLIEIAKSDGFLRSVVEQLNIRNDPDIAGSETDPARILDRFRKRLDISRRGLTYVIAMTFVSNSPEKSARYANAIAQAFVASQAKDRTIATDDAADWLGDRLKSLSNNLRASEDAVAQFKHDHAIVDAGREGTTQQLRIVELNRQVAAARLKTEEAKTRYEQTQRDLKTNVEAPVKQDLLTALRAQRAALNDQIAQRRAVLGDRHPELVIALGQLAELNKQIEVERQRNIATAKSEYETLQDQQKTLEDQLKAAEAKALTDAQSQVKLQELQRSADANKNIYEQFLARYKATDEQRLLQSSQTKIVSAASAPTRPTRPPLTLLLVAIAVASTLTSTAAVATLEARKTVPPEKTPEPPPAKPVTPPRATLRDLPVWARIPAATPRDGRMTVWQTPIGGPTDADIRPHMQQLLERIAAVPGQRGKIVLVTSRQPGAGADAIARSLNLCAVDKGMMSALIQVQNDSGLARSADVTIQSTAPSGPRASRAALHAVGLLLGAGRDTMPEDEDIRTEFALIVVDAPSLAEQPEVASLTLHADLIVLVEPEGASDTALRGTIAALSERTSVTIGIVINQAAARPVPATAVAS